MDKERYLYWQQRIKESRNYRLLLAFCGIYSVLLFLPLGYYLLSKTEGVKIILLCLIAVGLARGVVAEIIYYFYPKSRPYQTFEFIPVSSWLFSRKSSRQDSFPSGHTVTIVSASTVLAWYLPLYGLAGFLIALLVAFGRVRLGNHYPADILAGFVIGIACGLLTVYFASPYFFST